MVLSIATVFYRDVKYIVTIIISFGIFYAPVYYEPEIFGPIGSQIMMLNPASPILEGIRLSVAGLPQHMVTDEYQQNAKAAHDRYVARKKAQICQYLGWSAPSVEETAPEETSENIGEYMRKLSEMNSGKPSEYRTVNLMRTLYNETGTLIWTPYYLLYSGLLAFVGLFFAWRRFHYYEFIIPEYL